MAENIKSTVITNRDASPVVLTAAHLAEGVLKETAGYVVPDAAAAAVATYRFCSVPSNCRISQVLISAADFTTAGAMDVGIYQTTANGAAVVDADLFASALDLSGGPFANLDITYESGQYSHAESEKMLWEVLGLTADPNRWYDVVGTLTTTFNGGQPMLVKVRYTV